MGRHSHSPIWPFLLVVAFLFLLSIIAPREWEHIARRNSGASEEASSPAAYEKPLFAGAPPAVPANRQNVAVADELTASRVPVVNFDLLDIEPVAEPATPTIAARQNDLQPSDMQAVESTSARDAVEDQSSPIATEKSDPAEPSSQVAADQQTESQSVAAEPELATQEPQASTPPTAEPKPTPPASQAAEGPRWPMPVDLLRRLDALACECEVTDWVWQTSQLVVELCERTSPTDERVGAILEQLRKASDGVDGLVPNVPDRNVVIELLRVRHSLVRRLDIWELLPDLFAAQAAEPRPDRGAIEALNAALDRLDVITRQAGAEGRQWRAYLGLDPLRLVGGPETKLSDADTRKLAREVLARAERKDLTEVQRQFISSKPVIELIEALRPFACESFDALRLLADLERFEDTSQPGDARHVADDYLQSVALWGKEGTLAERLDTNYRNANIRLALSEKLLKRLMPEASTTTDSVRDQVLGLPTRGFSTTSTAVDVKLVPDERHLRVALEASGQVFANTRSTSGPATLFTNTDSTYYARKLVDLDLHGIRTWPAESECLDSRMRLRSVSTDFDGVPLVGALVETVARSRHADQQDVARIEVRRKIEAQARRKMDAIAQERFDKVNRLLEERVVQPLARLQLDPQVISAQTSEERLTVRLRLACQEQLAGYTPRPRAPGDSLLSFQVHQSTFNNVCQQLKLEGKTWTLPELRSHIIQSLNLKDSRFMDETDKDVSITFADENAIRVRCENGRIELSLAVARLTNESRTWKNFLVRVYYEPQVEGLQARLVREGTVQLIGNRLNAGSQIALRGIFSKAFAKDRDLLLVDPKWSSDERTRDLKFSQFVIQDGWIAVAVSEPWQNVARQPQAAPASR